MSTVGFADITLEGENMDLYKVTVINSLKRYVNSFHKYYVTIKVLVERNTRCKAEIQIKIKIKISVKPLKNQSARFSWPFSCVNHMKPSILVAGVFVQQEAEVDIPDGARSCQDKNITGSAQLGYICFWVVN